MIEQTGKSYLAKKYEKATCLAPGKVGKTVFLVGSALGVMPPQVKAGTGGIVDRPSHLHVIAVDSSAMTDVLRFLKRRLDAPDEIFKINIYNMEDDVARVADAKEAYDMTFFNSLLRTVYMVREKVEKFGGTHALIMSSLTGANAAILRGISGPPGSAGMRTKTGEMSGKGFMDPSKWQALSQQLIQLRGAAQVDTHHCLWETHIEISKTFSMGGDGGGTKETVALQGSTGKNWYMNTDHTYRMYRDFGDTWAGTKVDKMFFDTKPDMEFQAGGRGQDKLPQRMENMTDLFERLGLKVGGWNRRSKKIKK